MKRRIGARKRKAQRPLSEDGIARILRRTLPRRNGYTTVRTSALLAEALQFGIRTEERFQRLLSRHRRALIADDKSALRERAYLNAIREDYDAAAVTDMLRRQYCLSWEAMTKTAFELEFGEAYDAFARKRDGLLARVGAD